MGRWLVVGLICLLAILEVHAQNPGECLDEFNNDIKTTKSLCPSAEKYLSCVLGETGASTANLTNSQMLEVANSLNFTILQAGINCTTINYMAVLEKLRGVDVSFAHAPSEPKEYGKSTTVGDCLNALFKQAEKAANVTCSLFEPNVKCMVRTTEVYKHEVGSKEYDNISKRLEGIFKAVGMSCKFDFQAVAAEVAGEEKPKNSDPGFSSSTPVMLVLLLSWIWS